MKKVLLLLAALSLSACSTNYQTTFNHAERTTPVELKVLPVLNQEELDVQVVVADSSAAAGQFGLIGALVGAAIDAAANNSRAKKAERRAEVLRDATVGYELVENYDSIHSSVDDNPKWKVIDVSKTVASTEPNALVTEAFSDGTAEAVLLVAGTYELTPEIDQLAVRVTQTVYDRSQFVEGKRLKAQSTSGFTYFSPAHPLDYRLISQSEKSELIEELRQEYSVKTAAQPEEAKSFTKEMNKQIKAIEESAIIPEHIAIAETWTKARLTNYLDQAVPRIARMIELDWAESVAPAPEEFKAETFVVMNSIGMVNKLKGRIVERGDGFAIYQDKFGNYYSVAN